MRRWLIVVLMLGNLAFAPLQPFFQSSATFSDITAVYDYGKTARFEGRIQSSVPVSQAYLFLQPEGFPVRVEPVTLSPDGWIRFSYNLEEKPLRPFLRTSYWFRITLQNGEEVTSASYWFNYDDDRFVWQSIEDDQFEVHWYGRDITFGQDVINTARSGLQKAQSILPADLPQRLRIFVYASASDFQGALLIGGQSWMAGHASPEAGVILVSIPQGIDQRLELERQVPHEIAHILQYQLAGSAYTRIPVWFLEGTASQAELYPNPDYGSALADAAAGDALIPMAQLCTAFPREASAAFLSYAQATSFTRYLHEKYGTSGLGDLMRQYQDGVGCQEGSYRAFGAGLNELEYRWKQESLGVDMGALIFSNLSPFLALLGLLVFVPVLGGIIMLRRRPAS